MKHKQHHRVELDPKDIEDSLRAAYNLPPEAKITVTTFPSGEGAAVFQIDHEAILDAVRVAPGVDPDWEFKFSSEGGDYALVAEWEEEEGSDAPTDPPTDPPEEPHRKVSLIGMTAVLPTQVRGQILDLMRHRTGTTIAFFKPSKGDADPSWIDVAALELGYMAVLPNWHPRAHGVVGDPPGWWWKRKNGLFKSGDTVRLPAGRIARIETMDCDRAFVNGIGDDNFGMWIPVTDLDFAND